jgi:hypothetical protein
MQPSSKKNIGFFTNSGLPEEVEQQFKDELIHLQDDTRPLLLEEQISEEFSAAYYDGGIACLFADEADMIVPTAQKILRKVQTSIAQTRSIFDLAGSRAEFFKNASSGNGEDLKDDFTRAVWELYEFYSLIRHSGLLDDQSMSEYIKKKYAPEAYRMVQNYAELAHNPKKFVDEVYMKRMKRMILKSLKRIPMKKEIKKFTADQINEISNYRELRTYISKRTFKSYYDNELGRRVYAKVKAISSEHRDALHCLIHKARPVSNDPDTTGPPSIYAYDAEATEKLMSYGVTFIETVLFPLLDVSKEEASEYKILSESAGDESSTMATKFGEHGDAKTLTRRKK